MARIKKKKIRDMIAKGVWRNQKKINVPTNRRLVKNKWVFKIKQGGKYRARLCALGYTKVGGEDYTDNFAPVICDETFRMVLSLAVAKK